MSRATKALLATLVLSSALLVSDAASANTAASAQALFEEGRSLMASGNFAAACPKLEGSQKLDPAAGTTYNLALCYENVGRTASAWVTYLNAAAAYKSTHRPDWEAKARERAAALAAKLSKLTITLPEASPIEQLRVTRDGTAVIGSELGVPIPVDPGNHTIEATARGRAPFRVAVDVPAGGSKTVLIELEVGDAPAQRPEGAATDAREAVGGGQRTLGWVLGGVGATGVAVSAVTGLLAIGENATSTKDCPNDGPCPSRAAVEANGTAKDFATVSTVSFIAGAALLTTGIVLVASAPSRARAAKRPVTPVGVGVGFAGAGIVGAF